MLIALVAGGAGSVARMGTTRQPRQPVAVRRHWSTVRRRVRSITPPSVLALAPARIGWLLRLLRARSLSRSGWVRPVQPMDHPNGKRSTGCTDIRHTAVRHLRTAQVRPYPAPSAALASRAKSVTSSCSPRALGDSPALASSSPAASAEPAHPANAARRVLRRWANAASTNPNTTSRSTSLGVGLRVNDTRAESTLGTGQNTDRDTVPARRTSAYQAALTLGMP